MSDSAQLQTRINFLEQSLEELTGKYNLLCQQIKQEANGRRKKVDDGDRFLYNYAVDRKGPWQ